MKFPFEVTFEEMQANPDGYVSAIFSCLESEFLILQDIEIRSRS